MQWEAWLSHRPTLVLARIFLGKLGKEDTLALTLVQTSNITTYFMLFSRSPSPGEKAAPATPLSQLHHSSTPTAPAQSHLLGPHDVPDYRKGFYEVSLHYWREQSLTLSPLQTLSKKHTINAAISCWCVWFFIPSGQKLSKLPCYLPSIFMSAIFDLLPQNQNPSLNTEISALKKEVFILKSVLQAFFLCHIPSMPME